MIAIEPPEGSLQGARSHQPVEVGPKQPGQRFKATQVAPGSQYVYSARPTTPLSTRRKHECPSRSQNYKNFEKNS